MTKAPGKQLFEQYNRTLGRVPEADTATLQRHAKRVMAMGHYGHFLELVGVTGVGPRKMGAILREALAASTARGYHKTPNRATGRARGGTEVRGCRCGGVPCAFSGSAFAPFFPVPPATAAVSAV